MLRHVAKKFQAISTVTNLCRQLGATWTQYGTRVLSCCLRNAEINNGWLGHSTIAMTLDVYGHLFPRHDDSEELAAAERALDMKRRINS